jgi:hypothetical protein
VLVHEIDGRWYVFLGRGRWCLLEGDTLAAGLRAFLFVVEGAAPAIVEWRKLASLLPETQARFPVLERVTLDALVRPHPDLIRYLRDVARARHREHLDFLASIPPRRRRVVAA